MRSLMFQGYGYGVYRVGMMPLKSRERIAANNETCCLISAPSLDSGNESSIRNARSREGRQLTDTSSCL